MPWSSDSAEGWLAVVLLCPSGRGRVQLASTDLARQPPIWLPTPSDEDVVVLCHAVRRALDVLVTCAFQAICTASLAVPLTELERLGPWVRASAYSLPHTVETCAMGASPDTGAVVDAAGQVYGVTGCTSLMHRFCRAYQPGSRTWSP